MLFEGLLNTFWFMSATHAFNVFFILTEHFVTLRGPNFCSLRCDRDTSMKLFVFLHNCMNTLVLNCVLTSAHDFFLIKLRMSTFSRAGSTLWLLCDMSELPVSLLSALGTL